MDNTASTNAATTSWNSQAASNSYYFNTKSSPIDFSVSVLGSKDNEKSNSSSNGVLLTNNNNQYMLMNGNKEVATSSVGDDIINNASSSISHLPTLKVSKSSDFHKRFSYSFTRGSASCDTSNIGDYNNNNNNNNNSNNHHHNHHHGHFIDHEFPPNKKSIENRNRRNQSFSFINLIHSIGMKRAKCWLRPADLNIPAEETYLPISLYSSSSSRDVLQGGIGSCWFISALSVIAERPELLANILVTKSYNAHGLHQIRLCKRGEWVTVNIDDYLPCDRKGKVIFAYARYRQLWVSFIEKALAKLYGGYKAIVSGACVEGLQTLTGEPCEIIYLDQAQKNLNNSSYDYKENATHNDNPWQLWKRLVFAKNAGYLMTTLCYKDELRYFDMHRVGLFKRHIYSVLDVRELSHNGQIINLIKLRNPWGKKEWKGEWSNQWSHWPEHIKNELAPGVHSKNDGCFWISYQDLLKYFYDISICKIRSDWFESRHSSAYFYNYLDGTHLFVLQVVQPGEHQFEVELFATGRKFHEFDRNADPDIDLCLVICRVEDAQTGKGMQCVAFEHNVEYFINLSARLTAGYYYVFATSIRAVAVLGTQAQVNSQAEYKHSTPDYHSYNLVIHGQSNFVLNQAVLPPETVADVFYSVAKFSDKVRYELNGNLRTLIIPGSCTHAIIVENLSTTQFVRVNLDLSQSKNLESTRQATRTCDILAPGTRQLIAYLTPINYRKGFVIGYKIESLLTDSSTLCNQPLVPYFFSGMHGIRSASM